MSYPALHEALDFTWQVKEPKLQAVTRLPKTLHLTSSKAGM